MLKLTTTFQPVLSDGTDLSTPAYVVTIPFNGTKGIAYNFDVPTSDTTIDLGEITTIGYVQIRNRAEAVLVTTPDVPVITPFITGSSTWGYKVVAEQFDGTHSIASDEGTTDLSVATLDVAHWNNVSWTAVDNAYRYAIYRTTSGGTPSTLGLIGHSNPGLTFFNDLGFAGDASTPPAAVSNNLILVGPTSGTYPLSLNGSELSIFRWNGASFADIHVKADDRIISTEFTILDN